MRLDTDLLRLFVLAADGLNITAAGRQMGLSSAVASAWLAKLEKQVGADLFHRSTRKVVLSLEGAEFLPYARDILAQVEAANAALGHGRSEVIGTLRFAASSSFAEMYIMPILPEFLDEHPSLSLELKLSDGQQNLIEGGFDLALRNFAIPDSGLKARKLADDKRILCAAPAYLERFGQPQVPTDLIGHRAVTFMDGEARKLSVSGAESGFVFPPAGVDQRVICDDGASMRAATVAGAGISMNSLWSVHELIRDGRLSRVLPDYEVADQSAIWLVYPKSNVLTAKVRVFIDFLVARIGAPPAWEAHR